MIKKLAGCVREYLIYTVLSPLFMVGEAILEVMIPYYLADIVDLGINAGNMDVIRSVGLKLIFLAVCSLLCGIGGGLVSAVASAGFAKNLQHDMYYKIQEFSFSNIDKFSTAGLVTRMTTDVTNVQQAFMMLIRMAFRAPTMLIFALIMAFRVNSSLAMTFVYVLPVLFIGMVIIMRNSFPIFERMFKIYDKLNSVVQENVRGIRVVKAFVREDLETEKFGTVAKDLYKTNVKGELIVNAGSPLMQFCMYTCMLLISWTGAHLVVSSTMTTGQLMNTITYITMILSSLMMFSYMIIMFVIAGAAAKRITEVLDEEPSIKSPAMAITEVRDGSVSFQDVSFGYGDSKDCLEKLNFEIKSGETIGIIGGTGSGKSSLVQLIPRLYDVRGGIVSVGGTDVRAYDVETLRKSVAMVLQKNVLFSGTIAENLRWGKEDATDEEIKRACELAQAAEFIEAAPGGYERMIEHGGANVSGGQRQRLCIARALLCDPKILILDDSTSAVDTHTEALILKAFREDIPDITKIIIAQRISSVKDADRIIVMNNGQINGIGTHDELLARNVIYREVYESQMKGGDFDEPK